MLDADLAALYGVRTKALVQAVKRNARRFPPDFMFHVTSAEYENLRSRSVTSSLNRGWGGRRSLPHAFTEQGVRLDAIERKYDAQFEVVFDAIRALMMSESGPPRPIGFRPDEE